MRQNLFQDCQGLAARSVCLLGGYAYGRASGSAEVGVPRHVVRMNAWAVLERGRGVRDARESGRVVAPKPSEVRWEVAFPLTCSCLTGIGGERR